MEYKKPSVFVKNYKVLHEECKTVKSENCYDGSSFRRAWTG